MQESRRSQQRALRFLPGRNRGRLYLAPPGGTPDEDWYIRRRPLQIVADAQGTVEVPPGELVLRVNRQAAQDLAFLTRLDPDVLAELVIVPGDWVYNIHERIELRPVAHLTGLRLLEVSGWALSDQDWSWLPALRHLRSLRLGGEQLTDAVLAYVGELADLERLDIPQVRLVGTGFAALRELSQLTSLRFSGIPALSEQGWQEVGRLTSLRSLEPGEGLNQRGADRMLLHVGNLTNLERLDLTHAAIDGSGLAFLGSLERLHTLTFFQSPIKPHHLGLLRALPALQKLELSETDLDAEGLQTIAQLPGLTQLELSNYERYWQQSAQLRHLRAAAQLRDLLTIAVRLSGADLVALGEMEQLRGLGLVYAQGLEDASLRHLARLVGLEKLTIRIEDQGDEGLASLHGLGRLDLLEVEAAGLSERAIRALAELERLTILDLECHGPLEGGLERLGGLQQVARLARVGVSNHTPDDLAFLHRLPRLRSLRLARSQVGDAGAARLGTLRGLTELDLERTQIGDGGLRALGELTALRSLKLEGTRISTQGVRALLPLIELEELDLARTEVDDGVVELVRQFPRLERLSLYETRVSQAAVGRLAEMIPNCGILHRERTEPVGEGGRRRDDGADTC